MSALPPKADVGTQPRNVRFVPNPEVGPEAGPAIRLSSESETIRALAADAQQPGFYPTQGQAVQAVQNPTAIAKSEDGLGRLETKRPTALDGSAHSPRHPPPVVLAGTGLFPTIVAGFESSIGRF